MVFPGVAVLAYDAKATEEKRAQVETGPEILPVNPHVRSRLHAHI